MNPKGLIAAVALAGCSSTPGAFILPEVCDIPEQVWQNATYEPLAANNCGPEAETFLGKGDVPEGCALEFADRMPGCETVTVANCPSHRIVTRAWWQADAGQGHAVVEVTGIADGSATCTSVWRVLFGVDP